MYIKNILIGAIFNRPLNFYFSSKGMFFMFEKFLNLIFPNVCGFCNEINNNNLCENCELMISKYEKKSNTI